jgi:hypothetical protein
MRFARHHQNGHEGLAAADNGGLRAGQHGYAGTGSFGRLS